MTIEGVEASEYEEQNNYCVAGVYHKHNKTTTSPPVKFFNFVKFFIFINVIAHLYVMYIYTAVYTSVLCLIQMLP